MVPKPQMTLKRKIEKAQDIRDGVSESQLIIKYDCEKALFTASARSQFLNEDIVTDNKKRQKATKFEQFDVEILQWIKKARDKNIITGSLTSPVKSLQDLYSGGCYESRAVPWDQKKRLSSFQRMARQVPIFS